MISEVKSENKIAEPEIIRTLSALEENPELRAYFMEKILHSSYDLEKHLKELPAIIDDKIKQQISLSVDELNKNIIAINDAIKELPQNMGQEVVNMKEFISQSAEAVELQSEQLKTKIETINSMALQTISGAMRDNVDIFEKNIRESKEKIFNEGIKVVKDTNRQMAWVIIGVTLVINAATLAINYILKYI